MQSKITVEEIDEIREDQNVEQQDKHKLSIPATSTTENNISSGDDHQQSSNDYNDGDIVGSIGKHFSTLTDRNIDAKESDWYIVAASAVGTSHAKERRHCDDYHYCLDISNNWGVAVICDGAGSANHSYLGSAFVARFTAKKFKEEVLGRKWHMENKLPSDKEWDEVAMKVLSETITSLNQYASGKSLEFKSLSCTVVALIFSGNGLLVTHIGDGRAAYCNENREWKPIMVPHKGEEVNETVFITAADIFNMDHQLISGAKIPENRVIREIPTAFALMTDGCERHSFLCSKFDADANKWQDPNIPFENFFNPLVENLKSLKKNNVKLSEANEKWMRFLHDGMPSFKQEADDKTMILGILL